ncbi:MAG: hypothetical protein GF317_25145 [Candidatus Lokiarchaeota archaeon]|nr:hypothetical protein [Candidatus Lokiarchaeota archaeon]MBD3202646.1 hypothetical protein [Candidatus Lokiarchaeota archaeon]
MHIYLQSLPVIVLFIGNACGQLYYAKSLQKKFPDEHNFYNSSITVFLWIVAGGLYPLYFVFFNNNLIFFLTISQFFICIFTPFMIILVLVYQYLIVLRKRPEIKEKRKIDAFLEKFDKKFNDNSNMNSHTLKIDIYRKALHLFPAGLIILLWIFSIYVWDGMWDADLIWGITGEQFGIFLIITAGYSGILVFAALDYVRLSYFFEKSNLFHFLPDNVLDLLSKSMKRKEMFEFTKPVAMVLAFTPIFFLPFGIFTSAALISTLGDGAASLMGLKYGRIHFPKKSYKTIIGYISGFLVSFLISVLMLFLFETQKGVFEVIIISLVGALVFVIIDLLNLSIDDNILNPIFCGFSMGVIFLLI